MTARAPASSRADAILALLGDVEREMLATPPDGLEWARLDAEAGILRQVYDQLLGGLEREDDQAGPAPPSN